MSDAAEPLDAESRRSPRRRPPSLSAQVFIAFGLGIAAGIFFGELIAPVQLVGEIFIGLLQMTVLPYILVSLIAGIGRLTYQETRTLGVQGGRFILLFWLLMLVVVAAFGASFPDWESATFFKSSLVEAQPPTDLVGLYIPSNPFFSLANSVVPAVVLFSLALGLAVIGVAGKGRFLDDLDVVGNAIMRIAGFVARLAPIGVFALIASAAGTLDIEALGRLQVYILTYVGTALLLSLWIVPALVGALTPIPPRRLLSVSQDALVTAFATGSLLIVLPLIVERLKELLPESGIEGQEAEGAVDLIVPINFNLPNMGKLLSLAFVPFAGWFAGTEVEVGQLPLLLFSGLLSFFGEVVVALPFLLDLMRIPADMFELFVAVDVFTGRFGTLLAGVHTIGLAALTAAAVSGRSRWSWRRFGRFALLSAALLVALLGGLRFFFEVVVPQEYRAYEKLVTMDLAVDRVAARTLDVGEAAPLPVIGASRLAAIRQRGTLRVAYARDSLPFMYRNESGETVGLEADLAHLLAGELGVGLEFVRVPRKDMAALLDARRVDVAMSGLFVTPDGALDVRFSEPYVTSTLALIVPDHERGRFDTKARLRELGAATIAVIDTPYYSKFLARRLPDVEVVPLDSPRQFFKAEPGRFDALLYTAEAGSAWTLIYPRYSVVVPKPRTVSAPIALALPRDAPDLAAYVNTWLLLQRDAKVIERLHDYWILGEGADRKEPRWSVIRDVLGWVD